MELTGEQREQGEEAWKAVVRSLTERPEEWLVQSGTLPFVARKCGDLTIHVWADGAIQITGENPHRVLRVSPTDEAAVAVRAILHRNRRPK